MAEAAQQGRWVSRVPLGYRLEWRDNRLEIVLNPEVAPLIQEAFYWAAEGKHSIDKIRKIMAEKGLRSAKGKPLAPSSLWKILYNPFYTGQVRYKAEIVKGRQPAIVDKWTFEKVQSHMKKRNKKLRNAN